MLKQLVFALVVIMSLLSTPTVIAAFDVSWRPQIRLGTRVTDNLRTAINDPEAAWGFDMGGGLQLNLESNQFKSQITPAFNFRRFVIGEGADADEYEVRTSTQWSVVERAVLSLDFDYIRDSTLSTELTDAGRQTAVSNRDTLNVAPSVAVSINERTTLNLGFYYSDVEFEQLPGTPFADYEFKQVNGTLTHQLTEQFSIFANAYVSEFQTPSNGGKSLTYGGMGGASYFWSPTLDFEVGVGYVQSEIDFLGQEVTPGQFQLVIDPDTGQIILLPVVTTVEQSAIESGPIARATIRKIWSPVMHSELSYNRSVSPTVFGAQSSSDDILFSVERELSRRFVALFRGGYNMRSAETENNARQSANLDRNQTLLVAGVRYRFSQDITLAATYRFVYNDISFLDETSYNNSLFFTFTYNGELRSYRGF
ncbi:MAG: hypothetical protein RLW61_03330 [Gammaproteobacteria bacterium]